MYANVAVVVMLAAIAATSQFAQGPGGRQMDPTAMIQMRVANLTSALGLTSAQQAKVTEIYTSAATAGETIRTSRQSARQALADAIRKNDMSNIETLSQTSGTLSGQLIAIESRADAAIYAILTAGQQSKYDSVPHPPHP